MSLRSKLFALTYDRQMAKVEKTTLRALRESLLAEAGGDVLEIGGGTGANLPFYRPEARSLTITEPEPAMLRRLERCAREQAPRAKILRAPAEDLPFEDGTFDTVVSTMVLCGVSDHVEHLTMPKAPSFVSPLIVGSATAPVGSVRPNAQFARQGLA